MKLPILYSRNTDGSIQTWEIEVEGSRYRVTSGKLDGKKVSAEWTQAEEKNSGRANQTSPEQQALLETQAKFDKKCKSKGYYQSIKDIDSFKFVECMLAKKYKEYEHKIDFNKEKWVINIKLNGGRMLITKDGCFTRTGERYLTVKHIEEALEPFFNVYPDAVLDSECFNFELRERLNELMSLVRKTVHITAKDLALSRKIVQAHIYDGYIQNSAYDESAPYLKRFNYIKDLLKNIDGTYIKFIKNYEFKDKEEMLALYRSFLEDGQEGGILRRADMPYSHKRTRDLLKIKNEEDDEGIITNIRSGKGNWGNTGKIIGLQWKDKEFDATAKGTMEECAKLLNDKDKWIGKTITFTFHGHTGLGVPNYAQVNLKNCNPH